MSRTTPEQRARLRAQCWHASRRKVLAVLAVLAVLDVLDVLDDLADAEAEIATLREKVARLEAPHPIRGTHDYLEDHALALAAVVERLRARVERLHESDCRHRWEGRCTCGHDKDAAALAALDALGGG